jgi:hypothetical protein
VSDEEIRVRLTFPSFLPPGQILAPPGSRLPWIRMFVPTTVAEVGSILRWAERLG